MHGTTRPAVIVGHSFAALLVCAYASRLPDEIAGGVLLDPRSEWHVITPQQAHLLWCGIQLSRVRSPLAQECVVRALALLTGDAPGVPRKFVRVLGRTASRTLEWLVGEVRKLPPELHPVVQALWCEQRFRAMAITSAPEETAGGHQS